MTTTLNYAAFYLAERINLNQFKAAHPSGLEHSIGGELYYAPSTSKFLQIHSYGVVVFCNHTDDEIRTITENVGNYATTWMGAELRDDLNVTHDPDGVMSINFDHLTIGRFDHSVNRMIMMHLAQSVAMDHFNLISQNLLGSIKEYTSYLGKHGKISLSEKKALKFIGRTLSAKNNIAENLYIFDSPDNTWEDEFLDLLHKKLVNHFELAPRYKSIEGTLKIIEDNLDVHISYNHHRESSRLEWIIIILIVIEVVDTLLSKFI